jgi:hypothetical protein
MGQGTTAAVLAGLLLAGLAQTARADEQTRARQEGDTIVYQGVLSPEANARVRELLAADGGIQWLQITSGGGDVNLGLDLGELVREHGLNVKVVDYCASSCANYVFPAGRRKRLPADSVVIWHGSAIQAGLGDLSTIDFSALEKQRGRPLSDEEKAALAEQAGLMAYFDALRRRQEAFYKDIGVDQRVTVFGQDLDCRCDWTIPIGDMARFGITGIEAPDGYGSHLDPKGKPVVLLRLDDHPQYAASIDVARAGAPPRPKPAARQRSGL